MYMDQPICLSFEVDSQFPQEGRSKCSALTGSSGSIISGLNLFTILLFVRPSFIAETAVVNLARVLHSNATLKNHVSYAETVFLLVIK